MSNFNNFLGFADVVRSLVDNGADVNAWDSNSGDTPFSLSLRRGNWFLIRKILTKFEVLSFFLNFKPISIIMQPGNDEISQIILNNQNFKLDKKESVRIAASFNGNFLEIKDRKLNSLKKFN